MAFTKRNTNNPFVTIGREPEQDQKGNAKDVRPVVEGQLVGVRTAAGFANPLYDVKLDDGLDITVLGCAAINKHLSEKDIGRRIRLTAEGWGRTARGADFRKVAVEVDEEGVGQGALPY